MLFFSAFIGMQMCFRLRNVLQTAGFCFWFTHLSNQHVYVQVKNATSTYIFTVDLIFDTESTNVFFIALFKPWL